MNSKPETSPRRCLKCSKSFDSTGPANRLCHGCARGNQEVRTATRCESQGATISSDAVARLERRIEQEART